MVPSVFPSRGFTLLEVVVALMVVAALLIVGLASVQAGASARVEAAAHADLRVLAEAKLAELTSLPGRELRALSRPVAQRFAPPFSDVAWTATVREEAPEGPLVPPELLPAGAQEARGVGTLRTPVSTGLFRVEVEVRRADRTLAVATYVSRFGET